MSTYGAILTGTGSSLPERRLTNDDLSKMVETNDEWITQRTGIKERRIAGKDTVVLQSTNDLKEGIAYASLHADGNGAEAMKCMPGSRHPISNDLISSRDQYMKIRGREVYKFAVQKFGELIEDAMRVAELTKDQVKLIVPHQVNQRIIDSAMEKLGMGPEKAHVNIDRYGNTSAASIPIALDEAWRAGKIQSGDAVIFVAFGAGLTWANAVLKV